MKNDNTYRTIIIRLLVVLLWWLSFVVVLFNNFTRVEACGGGGAGHSHHDHDNAPWQQQHGLNNVNGTNVTRTLQQQNHQHDHLCGMAPIDDDAKYAMAYAHKVYKEKQFRRQQRERGEGEYNGHVRHLRTRNLQSPPRIKYTIYAHFHIIQESTTVGVVTHEQIRLGYMNALNSKFASTQFQFVLKSITKTIDPTLYRCSFLDETTMKQSLYISGKNVLNVYVCDPYTDIFFGNYGWSSLPIHAGTSRDGVVVINPDVQGNDAAYTIIVHEVGHWMGLLHTFMGGCSPNAWELEGYSMSGDGVKDTAAHFGPTNTYTEYEDNCYRTAKLNTCPDTVPGIDQGYDPYDNLMNYLPPKCFLNARFTEGQKERMVAEYLYFRQPSNTIAASANNSNKGTGQRSHESSTSPSSCRSIDEPCGADISDDNNDEKSTIMNNYNCCPGLYCYQLDGVCKEK